jgi:5-methylcytosine-specific restriction endonuclease McrA
MSLFVPDSLRKQVIARALGRCEYCHLPEAVSFYTFHIDHIRSIKHGGQSVGQNLAYACPDCNYAKGSDIGTYLDEDDDQLIRFFNPRRDNWHDHFELQNGAIVGITPVGQATERVFRFNDPEQLIFRQQLIALGLFP